MRADTPKRRPLEDVCDGCGQRPGTLAADEETLHYCDECMRKNVLYNAAGKHLADLTSNAAAAWGILWARSGLTTQELSELLDSWASDRQREILGDKWSPAGPLQGTTPQEEGTE